MLAGTSGVVAAFPNNARINSNSEELSSVLNRNNGLSLINYPPVQSVNQNYNTLPPANTGNQQAGGAQGGSYTVNIEEEGGKGGLYDRLKKLNELEQLKRNKIQQLERNHQRPESRQTTLPPHYEYDDEEPQDYSQQFAIKLDQNEKVKTVQNYQSQKDDGMGVALQQQGTQAEDESGARKVYQEPNDDSYYDGYDDYYDYSNYDNKPETINYQYNQGQENYQYNQENKDYQYNQDSSVTRNQEVAEQVKDADSYINNKGDNIDFSQYSEYLIRPRSQSAPKNDDTQTDNDSDSLTQIFSLYNDLLQNLASIPELKNDIAPLVQT